MTITDGCFEEEINYSGNDIATHSPVATPEDCQVLCQHNDKCKYWTYGHITEEFWYAGHCFLKNDKSNVGQKAALTSGPRNCLGKLSPQHTEMNSKIGDFKVKSGTFLAQKWGFSLLLHFAAGWVNSVKSVHIILFGIYRSSKILVHVTKKSK